MHVVKIMEAAKDTFKEFGGHAASGGFTVKEDMIFFLEENLVAGLATLEAVGHEEEESAADAVITARAANLSLLRSLERFAPFGMGNPKPVFMIENALITESAWFGKAQEHLRVRILQEEGRTDTIEAISFFAKRELGRGTDKIIEGMRATVYANLERDQFSRGMPIRLRLIAIK